MSITTRGTCFKQRSKIKETKQKSMCDKVAREETILVTGIASSHSHHIELRYYHGASSINFRPTN
jgi:hypothetical protein